MTKILTMLITSCAQCPHYYDGGSVLYFTGDEHCNLLDQRLDLRTFNADNEIYSNCPLGDANETDKA